MKTTAAQQLPLIVSENSNNRIAEIEVKYTPAIPKDERVKVLSPSAAHKLIEAFIGDSISVQEVFVVLLLNRTKEVIGIYEVGRGNTFSCIADPKMIFAVALKGLADGIIVAHNHPSGTLKASEADISLTKKLVQGGKFLDCQVLDHLIVTPEGKYMSLQEEGII